MSIGKKFLERGAALLTALLVTALAATIATAIVVSQRLLIDQSQMLINSDRLYLSLQGVQDWANSEIMDSIVSGYSPGVLAHSVFPKMNLNGIEVEGRVVDQEGLLNLNILQQTQNNPNFLQLMTAVNVQTKQDLSAELSDWIGNDNHLDDSYLQLHPPYRPAHRMMANASELRAVLDVDQKTYITLLPFVTALPTNQNRINLNTATQQTLMSIDPTVTASVASGLIDCRTENGVIQTQQDLQNCEANDPSAQALQSVLVDYSDYFLVLGHAALGEQELNLASLLKVVRVNNGVKIDILWQEIK